MLSFAEKEGAAHPYKISRDSQRAHRVLWYPTQAKVRLEWGYHQAHKLSDQLTKRRRSIHVLCSGYAKVDPTGIESIDHLRARRSGRHHGPAARVALPWVVAPSTMMAR